MSALTLIGILITILILGAAIRILANHARHVMNERDEIIQRLRNVCHNDEAASKENRRAKPI